jgi:hypothetical protein
MADVRINATTMDPELVERFLLNARPTLPAQVGAVPEIKGQLVAFEEHMSAKTFQQALDQLVSIGEVVRPRARFWSSLHQAARHMRLRETEEDLLFIFVQEASRALDEAAKVARPERDDG